MSELKLRVATRKSALAMAQTTLVAEAIAAANPGLTYELISMTTEGDRRLDKSLASFGGKGVFIKELEVALLEGRADIAVHSLKDMPAEVLPDFKLAAVLHREDPRDAFVARGGVDGLRFMQLPAGARVGTGSIRRVVQLKALRPDLEYVPIRGNIQTRLSKLAELDGVVLAAAGLKRMGLADQVTEYFSTEQMLPASGQGILAIETRHCEGECPKQSIDAILAPVNDPTTFCIAVAEMAFLKALNAGCQFPVASYAEFVDAAGCVKTDGANIAADSANATADSANAAGTRKMKIRGIYWDEKKKNLLKSEVFGEINLSNNLVDSARKIGIELADKICQMLK